MIPLTRYCDESMVFPVPGPPVKSMILPFGRPPLNNLSNPGIPVGVLRLPLFSGLAEDAAISDSQIKAGVTTIIIMLIPPSTTDKIQRLNKVAGDRTNGHTSK